MPPSGTRPTTDRVREALFSAITSRMDLDGTAVLDLFAGSGSLAFEALSRGAPNALLVENAAPAMRCLQENVAALGLEGRARLSKEDVLRFLKRQPPEGFDLVFMDPPYRKNLAEPALRALADRGWLAPGAFVTAEIEKDVALTPPASFNLLAERLFGQTRICIWTAS